MNCYIFVDLDETLIHTFNSWEEKTGRNIKSFTLSDGDSYETCERPGALEFLAQLRQIAPVYMLTAATTEYADTVNELFSFGFDPMHIYAREDVHGNDIQLEPVESVHLIDNLPKRENHTKIHFLRSVSKHKTINYIQCSTFSGGETLPLDEKTINDLLSKIK